jgi:hypothetical protein
MWKDMLLVLVGGLCASLGGFASTWYQAKIARKVRREETIGERQVDAYQKAARVASGVQSVLMQGTLEDTLRFVNEQGDWFWENRVFLPQGFQNKWISVKSNLSRARLREKALETEPDEEKRNKQIEDLDQLESFIRQLAEEAEKEILGELGLSPIEIEKFVAGRDTKGKD